MRKVRPTLRTIKQLPRDSFVDPSVFDRVAGLATASTEAREQVLSSLRFYRVQHPLLTDANTYFHAGYVPDLHKASTRVRGSKNGKTEPVYEVRSRTGAAWRGGVIKDDAGDPWLAHANSHDEFYESAPKIFADTTRYWPSTIDLKIREIEETEADREAEDIICLTTMVEALSHAVLKSPEKHTAIVEMAEGASFTISFEVELEEPAAGVASAHESL